MPSFVTLSARWAALQSRDPKASNAFIYSVTTTKIYCRPTCSSRLARRANVVFHDTPAEAEADGFRACKRCRPDVTEHEGDSQKVVVEKACRLLRKEVDIHGKKWGSKALAKEVGLTECHFCRVFKKVMGVTVGEYRKGLERERLFSTHAIDMVQIGDGLDDVMESHCSFEYGVPSGTDMLAMINGFDNHLDPQHSPHYCTTPVSFDPNSMVSEPQKLVAGYDAALCTSHRPLSLNMLAFDVEDHPRLVPDTSEPPLLIWQEDFSDFVNLDDNLITSKYLF